MYLFNFERMKHFEVNIKSIWVSRLYPGYNGHHMGFLHEHQKLSPQSGWMYVHSKPHLSDGVLLDEDHVIVLPGIAEQNEYV